MTLIDLMHARKVRHLDDSSHQIALGDTLSLNRDEQIKIHAVWPAHSRYGLSAFVISDFGHVDVVSLDGYGIGESSQSVFKGMVKHTGETSHGFPKYTEQSIEARFVDRIRIIVPIIHPKYFGKRGCALDDNIRIRVTNAKGLDVSMDTTTKPKSSQIYNYSPCILRNGPDGLTIHSWGKYAEPATVFAPVYDLAQHELKLETKKI